MSVTKIEEALIGYLTLSKIDRGTRVLIFFLLKSEDQKLEMCRYLRANEEATEEELLAKAREIAGAMGY